MNDIAIRVEKIGKRYRIGKSERYKTIRDKITRAISSPIRIAECVTRCFRSSAENDDNTFWALKDISFEVKQGEVLGIIGRNGAGKSTLLKILSRITEPTEGYAEIHGRVGSLLEVGTGFHPELTGRENIFLNGAILGMRRAEIVKKFDEIVAFAEVDKFIDTPVKHFSSGMYMRLAFAIAAHLEPEILVVDEVLAVGDVSFQKKCLGKMETVAKAGRTVLFVSHNLSAVRRLCSKGLLLNKGDIILNGSTDSVVDKYLSLATHSVSEFLQEPNASKPIHLRRVIVLDQNNEPKTEVDYSEGFTVQIEYEVNRPIEKCIVWLAVRSLEEIQVFVTSDYDLYPVLLKERQPGYYISSVSIPKNWLNCGSYYIVVGITKYEPLESFDRVEAVSITITDSSEYPLQEGAARPGIFKPKLQWMMNILN